jgi:hypothetical protein
LSELTTQERLKQAQARVRTLNSSRETIIGDARVEEQKLKQAYDNLRELGIKSPEDMAIKELRELEEALKVKLEEKLSAIETQLAKGEELIKKYNEAVQEN